MIIGWDLGGKPDKHAYYSDDRVKTILPSSCLIVSTYSDQQQALTLRMHGADVYVESKYVQPGTILGKRGVSLPVNMTLTDRGIREFCKKGVVCPEGYLFNTMGTANGWGMTHNVTAVGLNPSHITEDTNRIQSFEIRESVAESKVQTYIDVKSGTPKEHAALAVGFYEVRRELFTWAAERKIPVICLDYSRVPLPQGSLYGKGKGGWMGITECVAPQERVNDLVRGPILTECLLKLAGLG